MKSIPQLIAVGDVLPEAWEKSLFLLSDKGIKTKKESYIKTSGVDEILESSMKIIVKNPIKEPMIHMGCEGLVALEGYVKEILDGIKDDYIGKGWDYTYHQRLFNYDGCNGKKINQIDAIIDRLNQVSYSNRAQAITWISQIDFTATGPPCLQRIWCKIIDDEYLEFHTSWRSRDAYNAAFMNMYAMIQLQKQMAEKLEVKVGQYVDDSDSYHVYDRNFSQFDQIRQTSSIHKSRWVNSSTLKMFGNK